MMVYERAIYPLLAQFDAESVHERTLQALALAQGNGVGRWLLRRLAGEEVNRPVSLFGLTFPNILGMAAGFDKEARVARGLAALGFGHVEVGTLTPRPQIGNPRPRIFRLREDGALINRMGFPNLGVERALVELRRLQSRDFILGVSLGKQKETPLAEAVGDYLTVMRAVYPYADYLAVNISSPNTPGLRDLQGGDYLGHLLTALMAAGTAEAARLNCPPRPLLVKIAPDLGWAELDEILVAITDAGINGIIATNTTLARAGLTSPNQRETGGLSGTPVGARSNEIIAYIHQQTAGRLPIIGVGGVRTVADLQAKLAAGASLVQLYTGLVYAGPRLPGALLRGIAGLE